MYKLYELLTDADDGQATKPLAIQRLVPSQPVGVAPGKLYIGSDYGEIDYTGEKPRAGDMVIITGTTAKRMAMSGQVLGGLRAPLFNNPCVCRCGSNTGIAFYLSFSKDTPVVHVINLEGASLMQLVGRKELGYATTGSFYAASIAVDQESPYTAYVLDDRRNFLTIKTNTSPTITRGYWGISTFVISGGQYVFSTFNGMTDPYTGTTFPAAIEPDPPAARQNCLSVIEGIPLATMLKSPARYKSLSGGIFTTHNLTLSGSNYAKGLRSSIVQVRQKPASINKRYVIATSDDISFEVVEFIASTNVITKVIPLDLDAKAKALATACNRLIVLSGNLDTLNSTINV